MLTKQTTLSEVQDKARLARKATLSFFPTTKQKDQALSAMADALIKHQDAIMEANREDLEQGEQNGLSRALLDRLALNGERIAGMADGLREIIEFVDPIDELLETVERPNGLHIEKRRVPIGVIGMIYEARPNVTVDSAGLCLKSGNAVILRGGSTAIHSNMKIVSVLHHALESVGFPTDFLQFIENTDRSTVEHLLKCKQYVDVVIPRGGRSLIQYVVQNSVVPIIETGEGICHVYLHEEARQDKALPIAINAKCQRPSVCNAMETLLVDRSFAEQHLTQIAEAFKDEQVELRGCEKARQIVPWMNAATEEDWNTEYLDYVLAIRVVENLQEAIEHINRYGTMHSESIVTEDEQAARTFMQQIDAAAVYHNASTRFTDGNVFGFGAEIGISTQKLHARGPMGLRELTSSKYYVRGQGQIRE